MIRFLSYLIVFALLLAPCAIASQALAFASHDTNGMHTLEVQPHKSHTDLYHCPNHSDGNQDICDMDCQAWLTSRVAINPVKSLVFEPETLVPDAGGVFIELDLPSPLASANLHLPGFEFIGHSESVPTYARTRRIRI